MIENAIASAILRQGAFGMRDNSKVLVSEMVNVLTVGRMTLVILMSYGTAL